MEKEALAIERYESACRLITRLDSYRLLADLGSVAQGDTETLMQAHDEYSALCGVEVRSYQGEYGNQTLDRLRRVVGI